MTAIAPTIQWAQVGIVDPQKRPMWTAADGAMPAGFSVPAGSTVYFGAVTEGTAPGQPYPLGFLVYAVSPTVTMEDFGFLGSIESNPGTGKHVANFSKQAEMGAQATFSTPGTYTITVEYITSELEAKYLSTVLATPIVLIVS
jgi:hypothetical protein